LNLSAQPPTSSQGDEFLPVFSRAGLSRTATLVVALSLTAVSTGVVARTLGAAGTSDAGAIGLDRSNGATVGSDIPVSLESWRLAGLALYDSAAGSIAGSVRFEAAMAGNHAPAQHDAAAARLIERIRKVE
jgi:hypothetical protein